LLGLGCRTSMEQMDAFGPQVMPGSAHAVAAPAVPVSPYAAPAVQPRAAHPPPTNGVVRAGHTEALPDTLPAAREVPVNLDAVLRLTKENNIQIAEAWERLHEAEIAYEVANTSCVPNFLRKDTFKRTSAEAKVWQQRADLARVTNEQLLDAGNTYIDLLTARRGEAIARELEDYMRKVLRRAEALRKDEPSAAVLVEGIQGAIESQQQTIARLHQQGDAAATKLAYLLNLHGATPVPADQTLVVFDLVDVGGHVQALLDQALTNGPGVCELQGLRATVQSGVEQARGLLERLDDLGFPAAYARLRWAESKLKQVQLSLVDLRGKLTAGVLEAREAIGSGCEQIRHGSEEIGHARETYRLSNLRFQPGSITGATTNEIMQSIRGLGQAHLGYMNAVSAYDKAQVRLLLLLGHGPGGPAGACPAPVSAPVPDPVMH
jgi:outer membrane protein TolC